MTNWEKACEIVINKYGVLVDMEEDRFFICPECDEPIYEDDYPDIIISSNEEFYCPVCDEKI